MAKNYTVSIFNGKSKKDNTPYEALQVKIGDWDTLIFVKTKFELEYIKQQLSLIPSPTEAVTPGKTILDDDEDNTL